MWKAFRKCLALCKHQIQGFIIVLMMTISGSFGGGAGASFEWSSGLHHSVKLAPLTFSAPKSFSRSSCPCPFWAAPNVLVFPSLKLHPLCLDSSSAALLWPFCSSGHCSLGFPPFLHSVNLGDTQESFLSSFYFLLFLNTLSLGNHSQFQSFIC